MRSLSLLAGMTVKVDNEHYPLIIAVRLNPYKYVTEHDVTVTLGWHDSKSGERTPSFNNSCSFKSLSVCI